MATTFSSRLTLCFATLVAGCGGGGGGGGGPVLPPTEPAAFTRQAGLTGLASGPGTLRLDFVRPPEAGIEVALFVSTDRGSLFSSSPRTPAAGATSLVVSGLADGVEHFAGLGVRAAGGGAHEPLGPVLRAMPGAPIYVDAASTAATPDGLSPATAFPDVSTAVLTAFARLNVDPTHAVNVWVRSGTYPIRAPMPVTAGIHVYGGFGPAFDLATRDVEDTPTVWNVAAGQRAVEYGDQLDTSLAVVIDGVVVDGNGVGTVAIDTDATDPCDLELRGVTVVDMADRGLRLRNATASSFDVVIAGCTVTGNGADGLSGSGPHDYFVYGSTFAGNAQEGVDLDALVPETGGTATLDVGSSLFFGNGSEGLDCTLAAPPVPTSGTFSVRVRSSAFERNALAGCLIDADFEQAPGYSAHAEVRESRARGNRGAGFAFDLDAPLDTTQRIAASAYRVLAASNGGDGVLVTSESRPSLFTLSAAALVGNAGAGLRAAGPTASSGNATVAASHCLLAGNGAGGIASRDVVATAASSIAYQQPDAFDALSRTFGCVASDDPAALGFAHAPEEFLHVVARSGAVLTLAAAPSFPATALLELADDGIGREALALAGTQVTLSEAPSDFGVPGLLAAFAPTATDVAEDWSLLAGSIALGTGLGGTDAGPMGASAGGAPGVADGVPRGLLHALATAPAGAELVTADQPIEIDFSRVLDGATAVQATVRARRGASALGITLQTNGTLLTIDPPLGGWGAGDFTIELDGLRASDGSELAGALVLPFRR